jgi:hypothetical protein
MLVDLSATQSKARFTCSRSATRVFVKRLRRVGGKVLMLSDNRELFPNEEAVPPEQPFTIYGRVRWTGRSL